MSGKMPPKFTAEQAKMVGKLKRKAKKRAKKLLKPMTAGQAAAGLRNLAVVKANPITGVRGRGNYFTDAGEGGTSLVNKGFQAAGRGLAGLVGMPELGGMASSAGSWLSRVLGFGAYKIRKNSVAAPGFSNMSPGGGANNIPEFGSTASRGSIRVMHREYVADVLSSASFTLNNYLIHVGNTALWPWLATLSQNFEEAQIHGCIFEFKPTSAYAVAGTQAMGNVILATDYDVVDANYASKREMEIVEFSSSAMSNVCQIHPIECDPKQNVLAEHYIQYGATTIADFPDDPRFGCMGNFQIATNGMPTTGEAVGELWVTYDVELRKPQLSPTTIATAEYHLGGALDRNSTTFTATKETWSGFPLVAGAAVPFTYTFSGSTATTTAVTLHPVAGAVGSYIFSVNMAGTDLETSVFPVTPGPGVLGTNLFAGGAEASATGAYSAYNTSAVTVAAYTFSAAAQSLSFGIACGGTGTIGHWDIVVTKYNPGLAATRPRALTSLDKKLAERDERLERLEQLLKGQLKQQEWECGAAASSAAAASSVWRVNPTDETLLRQLRRQTIRGAEPFEVTRPEPPGGATETGSRSGSTKK